MADPRKNRQATIGGAGASAVTLNYLEAGSGQPAFLLLHGFMLDCSSWYPVIDRLARLGRVCAYDRLPFGRSAKLLPGDWQGPNPYTPQATLQQLADLLDHLALDRIVLIGNSAGGLLAVRAALAFPERVTALVLVAPAIFGRAPERVTAMLNSRLMNRIGPAIMRRAGHPGWLLKRSYGDPEQISPERHAQAVEMATDPNWQRALWEFVKVSTVQPDMTSSLGDIRQPVLVISGDNDRVVPLKDQRRLVAALPDAQLEVIRDAGHVPQEEQPDEFVARVAAWLRQTGIAGESVR